MTKQSRVFVKTIVSSLAQRVLMIPYTKRLVQGVNIKVLSIGCRSFMSALRPYLIICQRRQFPVMMRSQLRALHVGKASQISMKPARLRWVPKTGWTLSTNRLLRNCCIWMKRLGTRRWQTAVCCNWLRYRKLSGLVQRTQWGVSVATSRQSASRKALAFSGL